MSNILLTGGTGFIGNYILKELVNEISITKIILTTRNKNKALEKLFNEKISLEKIEIIEFDFNNLSKISNIETDKILECDKIFHIGGNISLSNSEKIIDINYYGTKFLLDLFINNKRRLDKFIFFSTAYAFGIRDKEVPEDWILEKPSNFRNSYEESKFKCEKLIHEYNNKYSLNFVIIRPSIVISNKNNSKENPQTIFLFGKYLKKHQKIKLYSSYESVLNFISLERLREIFLFALSSNNVIINATGNNVLVKDLKDIYNKLFNIEIKLIDGEKGLSLDNSINQSMPYLLNPQKKWETSFLKKNNLKEENLNIKNILKDYFKNE